MNNTAAAGPIYATSYGFALKYQSSAQSQAGCGALPPLTEQQLEEEALGWYTGYAGPTTSKANPYLKPNPACTGWMVNTNNADLVSYVNSVLQGCTTRGFTNCQ
jgi:hypothetical protein